MTMVTFMMDGPNTATSTRIRIIDGKDMKMSAARMMMVSQMPR